jgi:hypothetical protein
MNGCPEEVTCSLSGKTGHCQFPLLDDLFLDASCGSIYNLSEYILREE